MLADLHADAEGQAKYDPNPGDATRLDRSATADAPGPTRPSNRPGAGWKGVTSAPIVMHRLLPLGRPEGHRA